MVTNGTSEIRVPPDLSVQTHQEGSAMKSILGSYHAGRGGHAPGHIRDAFDDAIEAYQSWEDGEPEPCVEISDTTIPITRVFHWLHNCNDIMPSTMCRRVDDLLPWLETCRQGSTYAMGARKLLAITRGT
jgi:hypothetical protein